MEDKGPGLLIPERCSVSSFSETLSNFAEAVAETAWSSNSPTHCCFFLFFLFCCLPFPAHLLQGASLTDLQHSVLSVSLFGIHHVTAQVTSDPRQQ